MSAHQVPRRTVVVGGYGHVGRLLLTALDGRRHVVVAGRRPDEARRAAEAHGRISCPSPVDVTTGAGLEATVRPGDLVVNVTGDDPRATLLDRAIELGCDYADLTADPATIAALLDRDGAARRAGVRALAGIGLAPGATNVLARAAFDLVPDADHIDVALLLSVLDDFGPAAVEWTLATAAEGLHLGRDGRIVEVEPFGARTRVHLGGRVRTADAFGFPEQVFLPETLGVASASGWFALHPAPVGRGVAAAGRRARLRRSLARPRVRGAVVRLASALPATRRGGLVAATAVARRGATSARATLTARGEGATTAACAAALLDVADHGPPGVHLPEQAVDPSSFFRALDARGITVTVTAASSAPDGTG